MSVVYVNKIKVNNGTNDFIGYQFEGDTSFCFIDYKIVPTERLKDFKIEVLSSKKLNPIFSNVLFTNGANNTLCNLSLDRNSYAGAGFGGHFGDSDSLEYKLAHTLSRVMSDNIKVYKIDGVKIS